MLVAIALRRPWRQMSVAGARLVGLAIGALFWVVESYTRSGGCRTATSFPTISRRVRLHFAFIDELKSQTGTLLLSTAQ